MAILLAAGWLGFLVSKPGERFVAWMYQKIHMLPLPIKRNRIAEPPTQVSAEDEQPSQEKVAEPPPSVRGRLMINKVKSRIGPTLRRLGLVGLSGIVGSALTVLAFGQDWIQYRSQNVAQATTIAIMNGQSAAQVRVIAIADDQLEVQREIATAVAGDIRQGPTATAAAQRVAQLVGTQAALEQEKHKLEATLTAIATRAIIATTPSPPLTLGEERRRGEVSPVAPQAFDSTTPSSPLMQASSQVPGVSAELIEFSRFENMITVKLRFVNSSEEDKLLVVTGNSYLLDEATNKTYWAPRQSNSGGVSVGAGSSREVWAKYVLSEKENPQFLTLVIGYGILFEHIEVA